MNYTSAHRKFLLAETTPQERARWLKLREVDKLTIPQLAQRFGVTQKMAMKVVRLAKQDREAMCL